MLPSGHIRNQENADAYYTSYQLGKINQTLRIVHVHQQLASQFLQVGLDNNLRLSKLSL